jgi:hypothetical protein
LVDFERFLVPVPFGQRFVVGFFLAGCGNPPDTLCIDQFRRQALTTGWHIACFSQEARPMIWRLSHNVEIIILNNGGFHDGTLRHMW